MDGLTTVTFVPKKEGNVAFCLLYQITGTSVCIASPVRTCQSVWRLRANTSI